MAAKRSVKKTGKKTPLRRGGHSTQAKKPIGRKKPVGSGRKARKKTPRARRLGAQSGASTTERTAVLETSKSRPQRRRG